MNFTKLLVIALSCLLLFVTFKLMQAQWRERKNPTRRPPW